MCSPRASDHGVMVWSRLKAMFTGRDEALPVGAASVLKAEEVFTIEVEAALRRTPGVTSITRRTDDFAVDVVIRGQEATLFLGNVFAETRDAGPDARGERIRRLTRGLGEPSGADIGWEEARDRLVPLLRASSLYSGVVKEHDKQPIRRGFAPFLIECVAIDADDSFQLVTRHALSAWHVDVDAAFAPARENAAVYFGHDDVEPYDAEAPYPIWHVAKDDGYESSRLLLPGWLASFSGKVAGRPIAIVPHRSAVVVGGHADERCVRRLIDITTREHAASPRRISPAVYTANDAGVVVPLVLPTQSSLANKVALGHIVLAVAEYAAQKKDLEERLGEGIFVAEYTGLKSKDGSVTSYAVWSKDVPTLLPEAAEIAFVQRHDSKAFRVPWATAVEIVGACMVKEPEFDPPRWRTLAWPDDAMMVRLKAAELP